jgi:hypothetical protein
MALRHDPNADGKPLLELEATDLGGQRGRRPRAEAGPAVQPRPKTAAGWRVVAVPNFAVADVHGRSSGADGVVFATPLAPLLERINTSVVGDGR